jgi:hypothetical protein
MRSEPRQLLNHRQAIIQNRRSALPSRGCGCLRFRTSNCCRRQRFSAISRTLGLNAAAIAQARKRTTPPPRLMPVHSRGAKACDCQPRSPWTAILRPTAKLYRPAWSAAVAHWVRPPPLNGRKALLERARQTMIERNTDGGSECVSSRYTTSSCDGGRVPIVWVANCLSQC